MADRRETNCKPEEEDDWVIDDEELYTPLKALEKILTTICPVITPGYMPCTFSQPDHAPAKISDSRRRVKPYSNPRQTHFLWLLLRLLLLILGAGSLPAVDKVELDVHVHVLAAHVVGNLGD